MRVITKVKPERNLISILSKHSGRNSTGKITSRHSGGRHKRYYREIDFKRDKRGVPGRVVAFEYDPNRNVQIALVYYQDGEKRYILAPLGIAIGDQVIAGAGGGPQLGNAIPLGEVQIGTPLHNVELTPGRGGQLVRGAGTAAYLLSKDAGFVQLKLPSGEVRMVREECFATIGQLANIEHKAEKLGKAGRSRHMGVRPKVRGTAQHPGSHPHGGGEGRSGEGLKQPKTPWGKPARGLKTRKRGKYSDRYILQRKK